MNIFILGAGCSKSYEQSPTGQRMPVAKDFFKIFSSLHDLINDRNVLRGSLIHALHQLKEVEFHDPFKEHFDIEEVHSLIEAKLFEVLNRGNDLLTKDLYFRAYTELVFIFAAVVNDIANGPTSSSHLHLLKLIDPNDSIITFNWDILLDKALSQSTNWKVDTGYFVQPAQIYENGWKVPSLDESQKAPTLLKMHGSSNWLTGAFFIDYAGTEFDSIQEAPRNSFYVYLHSEGPYDCYDGRWSKLYEPFSYGYYPPNLPLAEKQPPEGMEWYKKTMRSPFHAPKGKYGNSGLTSMPLIIPPVKSKTYNFFGDLFERIWLRAEEDLSKAEVITFIGYSFPVTDIKSIQLFKNAFRRKKSYPYINIIDPQPQRIANLIEMELGIPKSHINVIQDFFSSGFDLSKIKINGA